MVFFGTPDFAVPSLKAIARACDVRAAITMPDRRRGRGLKEATSAVATEATALGIETLKPEDVNAAEWRERIAALEPDLFAVVAFGAILGPELLRVPRQAAINLHGSLLPEYRGASPVARALWDGCASTGVTTIWMDEGIDTGDVILQRWTAIQPTEDAGALAARLAELGAPLLAESLRLAHRGEAPRRPQPREGSYARRLAKRDGSIDWSLDADTIWQRQRAVTPWPGAATRFREGGVLLTRVEPLNRLTAGAEPGVVVSAGADGVDIACGRGVLRVSRLKPEGKPEMAAAEWARGARVRPGDGFGAVEVTT